MESHHLAGSGTDAGNERTQMDWRAQLRTAVRDIAELEQLLELEPGSLQRRYRADGAFPLLVPRAFVRRMRKGDAFDPLLLQVLPVAEEEAVVPGYGTDPLAEQGLARAGSIGKYPGRVLLITTGACPVHCRYCFRRSFPYAQQTAARHDWQPALDAIRKRPDVTEIILSGGDPLSLGNDRLERLIRAVEDLEHVTTLRIHTRFPIVLPARVEPGLTAIFRKSRLAIVIVVHANHPAELDDAVVGAIGRLRQASNAILNQSVLLRGINDSVETLIALSRRLLEAGIVPYYLHQLDRVHGAAHFEVDDAVAVRILAAMRSRVPGYLVPRLVRDVAGELSKTPIG